MTDNKYKYFSEEVQLNARYGEENLYDEIWKNVGKCVLCDLRDKYIIYEENGIVLVVSTFPHIDGNLMIIPRRHILYAKDFTNSEWSTVRKFYYLSKKILKKKLGISNVWYIYREGKNALKTVEHLHIHVVPYHEDLYKIVDQKLTLAPVDVAKKLRDIKYISKKKLSYNSKYGADVIERRITVDVLIKKEDKVLLCKHKVGLGPELDGWHLIGGTLDNNEDIKKGLEREVKEETGLSIKNIEQVCYFESTNNVYHPGYKKDISSILLQHTAEWSSGKAIPADDIEKIKWVKISELGNIAISNGTRNILTRLGYL